MRGFMNGWTIAKAVGGVLGAGLLALAAWLVLSGKVGPMKAAEERNARERIQRQYDESQRQQNLRSPFEAVTVP